MGGGVTAGVRVADEFGIDGSVTATLAFDEAPARASLRGDEAQAALQAANELARIAQGAELAGIARRALEITREYMTTRVQFGKPIGSFQALQHRLVDGLIQVELADACLRERWPRWTTPACRASRAAIKARCAHAATEMTRMAIQLHGAIGTTNEYDIGLYFKRAMTLASRWGNVAAHRRRYASLHALGAAAAGLPPRATSTPSFPPTSTGTRMPEAEFRQMVRALFASALSRASPLHALPADVGRVPGVVLDAVAPRLDCAGVAEASTAAWGCPQTS